MTATAKTLPEGTPACVVAARVESDFSRHRSIGHSSSMQPLSRPSEPVVDNYGTMYPVGTSVSQRATFNTLDNPFAYSGDRYAVSNLAAKLYFLVFMPTSTSFNAMRQAMDGQYGSAAPLSLGTVHGPFNQSLADHAPAELSRASAPASVVSLGRTARLTH